jgi:hypothetical protein
MKKKMNRLKRMEKSWTRSKTNELGIFSITPWHKI